MNSNKNIPEIYNRPGLPSLSYRIGDWASFRRRMLANLTKQPGNPEQPDNRPLAKLNTRANDDPAIALLDAWAIVADVLTFYQERIANEGYLNTATEQRSVLELARSIGYELNPGVAASTFLAFAVEDTPTSIKVARVPKGTQVVSVPQGEELPQTFETSTEIIANVDWNGLKPRLAKPQEINAATEKLYLQGIATQLQAGDHILLIDADRPQQVWYLLTLVTVEAKPQAGYTAITWENNPINVPLRQPQVFAFRQRATLFGYNAPKWQDMPDDIKRNFGGTINGGIFRSSNDGQNWAAFNNGLPTTDIRTLAFNKITGKLFVGTEGSGVFRYQEEQEKWLAVNVGLTNLNIQTLYIDDHGYLFAGTPSGGVFSSKDNGENWAQLNLGTVGLKSTGANSWESINTGLPNTVVRAIVDYATIIGKETISSNGNTVTGNNTVFNQEFAVGYTINAGGESRIVTEIINDTSLRIDSAFSKNLPGKTSYSITINNILLGTDEGIYYSADRGRNWQKKALIKVIRSLVTCNLQQGTGTISSTGTKVTGSNTNFADQLKVGDTITVAGDTKTVNLIATDSQELTLDSAFSSDLATGTTFFIGKSYIIAGTDDGIYRFENQDIFWNQRKLQGKSVRSLITYNYNGVRYILAGTNSGVFRSSDNGNNWEEFNNNLAILDVQALAVNEISGDIYAGTAGGVFLATANSNNWSVINTDLQNLNVSSLTAFSKLGTGAIARQAGNILTGSGTKFTQELKPGDRITISGQTKTVTTINNNTQITVDSDFNPVLNPGTTFTINDIKYVLAGTPFAGFVEDNATTTSSPEWPNFLIPPKPENSNQKIDLDTLYPKILADSWIVLAREDNTQILPCQVKNTSTVSLEEYGLTAKVTEIETETDVTSRNNFGLRETIVLVNSEQLNLVAEPLTVVAKQQEIFQDPIRDNQIYLKEYVAGLQVDKTVIVSGKYIRAKIKNIAGVYSWNGEEWKQKNQGLTNTAVRSLVNFSWRGVDYIVAGTEGGVFRSQDSGNTWEPINEGLTSKDITALAINPQGDIFAGTVEDGMFIFKADSNNWQPSNKNLTNLNITALATASDGRIFAGTTKGGIYIFNENTNSWTINNNGLNNGDINCIIKASNSLLVGTISGIYRSQNGSNWEQIGNNNSDVNRNINNFNVTAIGTHSAGTLFAGTADNGVYISSDNGETWEENNQGLTDVHIRCLDIISDKIFVGTDSGGVFRRTINNSEWQEINQGLRNIDIRSITHHKNDIYIGGIGMLISPDNFASVELKIGDLLQVTSVPIPSEEDSQFKKWHLRDRNGVDGYVEIAETADIELLPANTDDFIVSEVNAIATPPEDQIIPILKLKEPLKNCYDPETMTIYGNVVTATHGETIQEILGSGNGTLDNQSFILKKPPLTHVAAQTPTGNKSTLEVYVDGVRWEEVRFLFGLSNLDQNYITRIDDDGTTKVIFGDGESGARLPTGIENILAIYRSGIGLGGNLKQNQLTQLKTRPLGIQSVTNPIPATGAAPRESMEEARISAPLTVRTLDRIVSLQDFEDFARAFAGIGKAQVEVVSIGTTQILHITVGAIGGAAVSPDSSLYNNLVQAIDAARDPVQVLVQVNTYKPIFFNIEGKILIDPRRQPEPVLAAVRQAIKDTFAFENRQFGQPVTSAEAIAAMQSVPGVIAVDLDGLYLRGFSKTVEDSLIAQKAQWNPDKNQISPAEMLLLNPNSITLTL
ncbi:putative baseplate assembly protein [Tolypothrix sp. FACHB-123]|uniref:putative baseplate assembly protein n=1 Tax=Tolypothrix sp. FACHB-123 TaxID=2692868 RepID=UPI001687711C|nr:putative baseplate assembly protein [Tolypothrix sp. FACHB-123]MBD2355994.1 putative baseplate assembly protein [Tolypothrix sp. FACHB-123]